MPDGSTPGWRWLGTAGASESVGYPDTLEAITGRAYARFDAAKLLGEGVALPADGTAVANWVDLSGNGRDVSRSTAGQRPLIRTSARNLLSRAKSLGVDPTVFTYPNGATAVYDATMDALKITLATGGTSHNGVLVGNWGTTGAPAGTGAAGMQRIRPNTTYTALARIYSPAASPSMWFSTQGGWKTTSTQGGNSATKDAWVDIAFTFTTDADISEVNSNLYLLNGAPATAGQIVYVKRFALIEGTIAASGWVEGQPVFPGGLPVVSFDGVDDSLQSALTLPLPTEASMYMVGNVRGADTADYRLVSLRSVDTSSQGYWVQGTATVLGAAAKRADLSFISPGTRPVAAGTAQVIAARWGVGGSLLTTQGVAGTTAGDPVVTPGAASSIQLGSLSSGLYAKVDLAEVIIFDKAHDVTTRKRVEQWLGRKYGIAVAA